MIEQVAYIKVPNGGVTPAIVRFKTITIPKWIRLIPAVTRWEIRIP